MSTMTLNRRFTLATHGVVELLLGLATLVSVGGPFRVLGLWSHA